MTAATLDELTALEPIGLDELVDRAALLTRVDRKYVVAAEESADLLAALDAEVRVLEIDGRREFGYRSTYFDTPGHDSFLTSGRSRRGRWKVRTRSYLDSGGSWLEVKTRSARGRTLKQRLAHPEADGLGPARFTAEGLAFVADLLGPRVAEELRPVLVTGYRRSTLFLPATSDRVTIDTDLGWTHLEAARDLERPGLVIVETKTGSTPSAVDRLLWSRGHRPVRLSKYGVGMAHLDPDLPRLKWHDAMHRHLGLPIAG